MATVNETLAMLSAPIGYLSTQGRSTLLGLIASQNRPGLMRFLTQNNPILQPMRVIELVEQVLQSDIGAASSIPFEERLIHGPGGEESSDARTRRTQSVPISVPISDKAVATVPEDFYGFETTTLAIRSGGGQFPAGGSNGYAPAGAGVALALAGRALRLIMGGGGGRLTAAIWNSLPSLVRSALIQAGIGVGALIAFNGDIPFITLPGQGPGTARSEGATPQLPEMYHDRELDIQVGRYYDGRIITKTWVANGIQFWATGVGRRDLMHHVLKLDGSIKSWKPPRPVVLMPNGAKNIRDLLRADDIVDRQLKKVAKALRRRNPTPRKPKGPSQVVIVDPQHAALHS